MYEDNIMRSGVAVHAHENNLNDEAQNICQLGHQDVRMAILYVKYDDFLQIISADRSVPIGGWVYIYSYIQSKWNIVMIFIHRSQCSNWRKFCCSIHLPMTTFQSVELLKLDF